MSARVRVRDRGANRVVKAVEAARGMREVRVGIMGAEGGAGYKSGAGMTVAEIAEFHEFGFGNNPRRSWLRDYVDQNEAKIRTRLDALGTAVFRRGRPVAPGLEQFGSLTAEDIKDRMADGPPEWPALSEAYANSARRGKNQGDTTARLIDTGQLRSSITHLVVEGGG